MQLGRNRTMSVVAATLAALALGAAPALAGEDDDGDSDGDSSDVTSQSTPSTTESGGGSASVSGAPSGGVATGAGGMASYGPDTLLAGLASGALLLVAGGGTALVATRRAEV
jgi:hypothetical protein